MAETGSTSRLHLAVAARQHKTSKIITAEILDSELHFALHVSSNVVHGLFGSYNNSSPYIVNGVCRKRYFLPLIDPDWRQGISQVASALPG